MKVSILAAVIVLACLFLAVLGHPPSSVLPWLEGIGTACVGYLFGRNQTTIMARLKRGK